MVRYTVPVKALQTTSFLLLYKMTLSFHYIMTIRFSPRTVVREKALI